MWVIRHPKNFYTLAQESLELDSGLMENAVVLTFFSYAGLTMFSVLVY
jgi:hypothetical protein